MKWKNLILIFVFIIGLIVISNFGHFTSAADLQDAKEIGEIGSKVVTKIEYTENSKRSCQNGNCNIIIYPDVNFVKEEGVWKDIREARSLKNSSIIPIFLEIDKNYPVEIVDYNWTTITVKLNPSGISVLNKDIPIKVWEKNETKELLYVSNKSIKENISIDKEPSLIDYKEKMDNLYESSVRFNLLNQEEELVLNFSKGDILEFGPNSTTITINSSSNDGMVTYNIGPSFTGGPCWEMRDFVNGNNVFSSYTDYTQVMSAKYDFLFPGFCSGAIGRAYFFFDTSYLGSSAIIDSVSLNLYAKQYNETNVTVEEGLQNDTLGLSDYSTWTGNLFGYGELKNDSYVGISLNQTGINYINKTGVTKLISREYNYDYLNITPPDSIDQWDNGLYFSEGTYPPYLNITYTSCTCPGTDNDWTVNMEENCLLNETCDLGTGSLIFVGNSGTFNCTAQLNLTTWYAPVNNTIFYISNGCEVNML